MNVHIIHGLYRQQHVKPNILSRATVDYNKFQYVFLEQLHCILLMFLILIAFSWQKILVFFHESVKLCCVEIEKSDLHILDFVDFLGCVIIWIKDALSVAVIQRYRACASAVEKI